MDDKDVMTEEELQLSEEDTDNLDERLIQENDGNNAGDSALNTILGEGHGLKLKAYCGGDYYDVDGLTTALVLEYTATMRPLYATYGFGLIAECLGLPFLDNPEVDEKLERALQSLGMAGSVPDWCQIATYDKS